ncbi:MAG: amidohydrolase family protein, partial [Anaerolineaceae bacterium]|nr:amidohydrolase family protein [Anaerolineaceae bacterium]
SGVAHNPSSNIKLASGFAQVSKMIEIGLNVGIGTDGTASNNDLDMFEEIRLAAMLGKAVSGDPTALPAKKAIEMGTLTGAKCIHIDHITGSLEVGKRADIILVDIQQLHNAPRFRRDPDGIYAQLAYASKSSDVSDVMINGKWVMQDKQLLTLNEQEIIAQSQEYATKIDEFLIKREKSVLSKLIAIGGAAQEESFEVQSKVSIVNIQPIHERLLNADLNITRKRHYKEYDAYFSFEESDQGYLRYREDHFIDEKGEISKVRNRLTHIGIKTIDQSYHGVMLSRSRYIAPAVQTLRFYKEYFQPAKVIEIEKSRLRYLVEFKGEEFFINLDTVIQPSLGFFLEIKSRTWSRNDANQKTELISELIKFLGADPNKSITRDYIQLASGQ